MTYFILGVVMWGSGLIGWGELGLVEFFFNNPETSGGLANESVQAELVGTDNRLGDVAGGLVGPILAVWGLVTGVVTFLFWPVFTLAAMNAPPELTLLLGGTPVVGMFLGVIRTVRESA